MRRHSEGDPETGTQGENQFDAVAVDRAEGGQRGVVHDPHVSTRRLAKFVWSAKPALCSRSGSTSVVTPPGRERLPGRTTRPSMNSRESDADA